MENCLLCLEHKREYVKTIEVNSNLWKELNINSILKRYLWSMNHIRTNSWVCSNCWRELYDFHKFYKRIEEAHKLYGLFKNENDDKALNNEEQDIDLGHAILNTKANRLENGLSNTSEDELKDILYKNELNKEILINDLMLEDLKQSRENESNDSGTFVPKRKRGRPRKSTVDNTIQKKKNRTKYNDSTNSVCKAKITKKDNEIPRHEPQIIRQNDRSLDNDSENEQSTQLLHKFYDIESDANNDRESDSIENKPNTKKNCTPKTDKNEKDKFLKENFNITCFLCTIPFETFFSMRKHFDEHHTERGHVKCCNKKFYRRSILVDHVHFHLNPNYFKCNKCGKVMADRRCLELHAEIHESNQEKNHCCDICGKGFAKLGVLRKHRMIHLSEEEKCFSCSGCGKNFASNYLLSSHYRSVHLKKYTKICDICGKSIRCKDVFDRHMLQHEGKTVPSVNCDECGLVLTDKKALKRHKDVIHPIGGQHEYTCSICSKTSPNLRAHKRHVQYKHVMGYDHKCTICDKAFKRAPTLKEHMASHTGSVLYTCPWCPKTFNSNANMHNHRKKVHPKEWEEASRKRYSGNLPPNFKPPAANDHTDFNVLIDI